MPLVGRVIRHGMPVPWSSGDGTDGPAPYRYREPIVNERTRPGQAGRREEMVVMMSWNSGWAWWQAGLMWLAMIAFVALVIWLVYALVTGALGRTQQPEPGQEQRGDDARRILDERLARGEIDIEEYRRLRDVIAGRDQSRSATGGGQ